MQKVMKPLSAILAAFACLFALFAVTACSSESAADKAYTAWASTEQPKIDEASTRLKEPLLAGDINAMKEYLGILQSTTEKFAAIDQSQLTGEKKTAYPEQLAGMQANIEALQAKITASEGQQPVDQGQGETEQGETEPEETVEDEGEAEE
ncbi:MAG: hypothetical protein LBU38_03915 [Propionibacteriaceae bacterium]|jgi:hypothetical protein|nr:hypothetical protein [Propionibacteriaceae bacterium]